ncbi:MAG: eCIS core domain-containing protein [Pseudomonas sp.]|uniref:eCIS core domain-containing protein n=1 Tax=Pseudomonas sp. TaxID=306 RepID=UPI003D6FBC1B
MMFLYQREFKKPLISTRLIALLILCLTFDVSAQTGTCPPGEKQICLDGCICLPDLGPITSLPDSVYQIAWPALALWLNQSRAEAATAGTQPIPEPVREQLLRWYKPSVLDAVLYKISDNGQFNAANAMLQNPDVGAVTLVDIIIFRDPQDAEQNIALWAHELKHVQQYEEWGVEGFAQRYTQDFNAVEAPAYAIQLEVGRVLREGTAEGRSQ